MRETIQNANGKQFHAVSLSGGKDSSAMLLLMIERDMPINMVLSADTGMEFPEMYEHLAKLDEHLFRERGIHITTLRHPKGFEYLMFDEPKQKPRSLENRAKLGIPPYGNGWPGIRVRWCTGQLKTHLITKEVNRLKGELGAIHYVGIAADEAWRCKDERYPLVEWGITEAQALQACYDRGFDFGGLYEIYHRASCWCCPFQRMRTGTKCLTANLPLRSARSATTVFVRGAATLKALSRHSLICQNRKPATSSTPRFSATKRRSF